MTTVLRFLSQLLCVTCWKRSDLSDLAALPCDIDRRDGNTLTEAEFWRHYALARRPLIITGLSDRWPAADLWQPEHLVSSALGGAHTTSKRPLRDVLQQYGHPAEDDSESPEYYWDSSFFDRNPEWLAHYNVERFFRDDLYDHTSAHAMQWRWLLMSGAQGGTRWHRDPYNISAWNAVVVGRKLWAYYEHTHTRVPGLCDGLEAEETCGWANLRWFRERMPQLPAEGEARPQLCVQDPGEIMFIPGGHWHAVMNLDDPTVAVTQNFCSRADLRRVLDGMKHYSPTFATLRAQTLELIRQNQPGRPELFSAADLDWAAEAQAENEAQAEIEAERAAPAEAARAGSPDEL